MERSEIIYSQYGDVEKLSNDLAAAGFGVHPSWDNPVNEAYKKRNIAASRETLCI